MQTIEAGRLRDRRLAPLPRQIRGVRPTSGLVKGAIFHRLHDAVDDAVVLDLFSGSGVLSFEALSRGAARAILVDQQRPLVRHLIKQVALFELEDQAEVHCSEVLAYLRGVAPQPCDVVFLDPPYDRGDVLEAAVTALAGGWLRAGAVVVCERACQQTPRYPPPFVVERCAKYGQTAVDFLGLQSVG
jgi:16S rRNA (guanine966-N2)-methyltransferase